MSNPEPSPRSRLELLAVALLLAVHVAILVRAAWSDSDTPDEPGHLVAGLSYWHNGTFRLYQVNPPLSRLVQALPLLPLHLDRSMLVDPTPGKRPEAGVGASFAFAHAERYRWILFLSRCGTIAFSVAGAVMVWWWANSAFGVPCGLVALTVWCFEPSILAQGHLTTPDLPAAVMALAAALGLRAYLLGPTPGRAIAAGLLLGLAQLTKFTLLVLYPVWLAVLLWFLRDPKQPSRIWHGVVMMFVSLFVLNAGYLFQETGKPLETFRFGSSKLGGWVPETVESLGRPTNSLGGTWLGAVPVPLPAPFVEGIDLQAIDFDKYAGQNTQFFMAGTWSTGRYHYYAYGLLVKTPLALFGLLLIGLVFLWRGIGIRPVDRLILLAVPLVILVFVSGQIGMNKHVRYVLPVMPFLVVLAGAAGRVWHGDSSASKSLVAGLLLWMVVAGARSAGDPLAYFNEAVGGPRGGVHHLAGSNLDWGQGLYRLRDWVEAHPEFRPIRLACFGNRHVPISGLTFALPPDEPHPGRYAVSLRVLQGDAWTVIREESEPNPRRGAFTYFRHFEPVAVVGDSIWIFDISPEESNRVRQFLGLPPLEVP